MIFEILLSAHGKPLLQFCDLSEIAKCVVYGRCYRAWRSVDTYDCQWVRLGGDVQRQRLEFVGGKVEHGGHLERLAADHSYTSTTPLSTSRLVTDDIAGRRHVQFYSIRCVGRNLCLCNDSYVKVVVADHVVYCQVRNSGQLDQRDWSNVHQI